MSGRSVPSYRMGKATIGAAACVLFSALILAAQEPQAFKGEITDSTCATAGHAAKLEKGETAARCTIGCVKMGAKYVLVNSEDHTVYQLDNKKKSKALAGQNVFVVGTLDQATGTIHVKDMMRALPPKIAKAKSVYIFCDACPRGMAAARRAAFQALADWGRFKLLPDPDKNDAEMVFLFSANRYLGDYGTRDGPDSRPASVDITYMNVVDPATGVSLWGDSRRWGSWMVSRATRDLIREFREQLEAEDGNIELFMDKGRKRK